MKRKTVLGFIGLALGLIGLVCSVGGPYVVDNLYPLDMAKVADNASDFISDVAVKTSRKLADEAKEGGRGILSRVKGAGGGQSVSEGKPSAPAEEVSRPEPVRPDNPRKRLAYIFLFVGLGAGFLAIAAGATGWVRGEDHKAAVASVGIGLLAIAWAEIMAAIGLAIVAVIICKLMP